MGSGNSFSDFVDVPDTAFTDFNDFVDVPEKPSSGATRSFAPEDLATQAMDEERRSKSATLSNVLPDIARIGKDAWGMVTSPVQTLKGAYGLVKGAAQTAARDVAGAIGIDEAQTRPNTPEEASFMGAMEPIAQSIDNPEGIIPRLKKFTEERPVMSLLNASIGVSGLGKAAEAMGAADTGVMIGKVGTALNPAVMAGEGVAATAKAVVPPLTRIVKESLGAYTGRGPGFVEEMVKGAESAEKAMRGEITGEEVVSHAREGLQKLRDMRSEEYVAKLENVKANPEELQGVASDLNKAVERLASPDRFDLGIAVDESGKLSVDFSKSTIVEHQAVVKRALEDINGWTDNSAAGLDTLKKRLSTYIDQSGRDTPAKALVTQLEKNLSGGLKKAVPEYEQMTAGYREASTLIKDIESNLMLRKEGMSGRVTADQTLRRLSSAFRENFEMRKDLLRALGTESGMDIPAEVAGYLAQQWLPAGMIGKGLATANAYLGVINPKMWPILAASSPRVVGEFLNAFGKAKNWAESKTAGIKAKFGPTGPAEGPPPDMPQTRGFRGNERLGQAAIDYTPFIDTTPRIRAPYETPPELPAGQGWTTPDQKMLRPPYETPLQLEGQGFTIPEGTPYLPEVSKTIRQPWSSPWEPPRSLDIPPGPRPDLTGTVESGKIPTMTKQASGGELAPKAMSGLSYNTAREISGQGGDTIGVTLKSRGYKVEKPNQIAPDVLEIPYNADGIQKYAYVRHRMIQDGLFEDSIISPNRVAPSEIGKLFGSAEGESGQFLKKQAISAAEDPAQLPYWVKRVGRDIAEKDRYREAKRLHEEYLKSPKDMAPTQGMTFREARELFRKK